jgi:hypothetical protein
MHQEVAMNEIRFVTIFAAAIAGWIVIMWLTLSAVDAAQRDGAWADKPSAPAATVDAPATPPADADDHGAALTPCAARNAAQPCVRAGGIA